MSDGEWGLAQKHVWVAAGRISAAASFLGGRGGEDDGVVAVE